MDATTAPAADNLPQAIAEIAFAPLTCSDVVVEPAAAGVRPDAELVLSWMEQRRRFVVEYLRLGTPKEVAAAEAQVRALAARLGDGIAPMLIAPYFSANQIERLAADGISSADLSGNLGISVPGQWLVLRTGRPNKYPASAPIRNVYRGTSALVSMALLSQRTFPTAKALEQAISASVPITAPTISKVLRRLEDDLVVRRTDREIRLVHPDRLLESLRDNYQPVKAEKRVVAKLTLDVDTCQQLNGNATSRSIMYAADATSLYSPMPTANAVMKIYTTSIVRLTDGIGLDTESRFPTAEFIQTDAPGVYYGRRIVDGLYRTSMLQVYLELATGGTRERQMAAALQERVSDGPQGVTP